MKESPRSLWTRLDSPNRVSRLCFPFSRDQAAGTVPQGAGPPRMVGDRRRLRRKKRWRWLCCSGIVAA